MHRMSVPMWSYALSTCIRTKLLQFTLGVALCTPKGHFPYYGLNVDSQICKHSWLQKIWILLLDFHYKYSYKSFVKVRCTELKNMRWRKPKYSVMWITGHFQFVRRKIGSVFYHKKNSFKVSWNSGLLIKLLWTLGCLSLPAAPHAGDDCPDASPDEDEAWWWLRCLTSGCIRYCFSDLFSPLT